MKAGIKTITLALAADGDALPTEFRLFTRGWNDTENGRFLFDDAAAASVMAAYQKWGVDLAIDLNHQMIEAGPDSADPTARDARGSLKLELRNGELWAVDVHWTPDGAERLRQKRQRYVSPAFAWDEKTKRVLKMINVAITAMPATHNTPALVAAAAMGAKNMAMEKSLVEAALEALEQGDDAKAMELLKSMIASAASGEEPGDADGSADDGAEGTAPPAEVEKDAVIDPKVVDNDAPEMGDDEDEDDKKPAKKAAYKAMRVALSVMTGKKDPSECLAEIEAWRTSHVTLSTQQKQLAKDRAVLEADERRRLVTKLVTLGAEFPATVWADDKATTLKSRWLKMPIVELRAHVAEQTSARAPKAKKTEGVKPPPGDANDEGEVVTLDDGRTVKLSAFQMKLCKEQSIDPKHYASLVALRDGAR